MQHPDDEIAQALRTLTNAAPPAGMESRILHTLALREQAANHTAHLPAWFRLPLQWRFNPLRLLAAAAAVCVLTIALFLRPAAPPAHPLAALQPANFTTAPSPPATYHPSPRIQAKPGYAALRTTHHTTRAHIALNHPPPPLPLTRQEQLLIQLAQHHNAQVRALLDPDQQNRLLARNDEAFDRFFTPPTPPLTKVPQQPETPGGTQ